MRRDSAPRPLDSPARPPARQNGRLALGSTALTARSRARLHALGDLCLRLRRRRLGRFDGRFDREILRLLAHHDRRDCDRNDDPQHDRRGDPQPGLGLAGLAPGRARPLAFRSGLVVPPGRSTSPGTFGAVADCTASSARVAITGGAPEASASSALVGRTAFVRSSAVERAPSAFAPPGRMRESALIPMDGGVGFAAIAPGPGRDGEGATATAGAPTPGLFAGATADCGEGCGGGGRRGGGAGGATGRCGAALVGDALSGGASAPGAPVEVGRCGAPGWGDALAGVGAAARPKLRVSGAFETPRMEGWRLAAPASAKAAESSLASWPPAAPQEEPQPGGGPRPPGV